MNLLESAFFGLVQGLTEFLPISSTAHLTLFGKLFGKISAEHPEQWTAYIAVIQLGTLLSVLIYFWHDVINIIRHFFTDNLFRPKRWKQQSLESKLGWWIILGTLPVVAIGLLFKQQIEGEFTKNLTVIAVSLIALGVLLGIAEKVAKHAREMRQLSWLDALVIGIAQSLALIPGSSRSGTTITAGLFMGLTRETAARFSFLLSLPAILASGLLQLKESLAFLDTSAVLSYLIGIAVAFITGYWAIDFLLKFLRTRTTFPFIWYRILLGILLLVITGLSLI